MRHFHRTSGRLLAAGTLLAVLVIPASLVAQTKGAADPGVVLSELSPVVDHPYLGLDSLKLAVYTGKDRDPDTGRTSKVRTEVTPRDTAVMLAGIKALVLDVVEFQDDEKVENKRLYLAQHPSGAVYYLAEHVDDLADGKVVGHEGQWEVGVKGTQAGVMMPPAPKVGDVFEPEKAPGIARDRSKVVAVGRTAKVAAGTFTECIEVESFDPIEKTTQRRTYCPGVGLVKETSPERTVELTSRAKR